jgi:hypothetical protein
MPRNGGRSSRSSGSRPNEEALSRLHDSRCARSGCGPTLPTWALQQVGSYRGYTGRAANVVATAPLTGDIQASSHQKRKWHFRTDTDFRCQRRRTSAQLRCAAAGPPGLLAGRQPTTDLEGYIWAAYNQCFADVGRPQPTGCLRIEGNATCGAAFRRRYLQAGRVDRPPTGAKKGPRPSKQIISRGRNVCELDQFQ